MRHDPTEAYRWKASINLPLRVFFHVIYLWGENNNLLHALIDARQLDSLRRWVVVIQREEEKKNIPDHRF